MKTLIIGYGDPQQGDAGAGYRAAEAIASWGLQSVETHSCLQLTSDLAAALAEADQVIFIEAAPAQNPCSPLLLQRLFPQPAPDVGPDAAIQTSINIAPQRLLTLANADYSRTPKAYRLLLPTRDCQPSEKLSPIAESGLRQVLRHIRNLLK